MNSSSSSLLARNRLDPSRDRHLSQLRVIRRIPHPPRNRHHGLLSERLEFLARRSGELFSSRVASRSLALELTQPSSCSRANPSSSPELKVSDSVTRDPHFLCTSNPDRHFAFSLPWSLLVPLSSLRSDGFANLLGGLIISGTFPTLPEVGLFFNGTVWRGNRTRKISNEGFDAFEGEGGGVGALITGESDLLEANSRGVGSLGRGGKKKARGRQSERASTRTDALSPLVVLFLSHSRDPHGSQLGSDHST